jgi:SAM-dependent methyltransferase
MTRYAIKEGTEGKDRLNVLAAVMRPSTLGLLRQAGIAPARRCLDVGCGGGHVAIDMAKLVGPTGHVTGIDFDETILELARRDAAGEGLDNVEFRAIDAKQLSGDGFDLAYARFLLSHVGEPLEVVRVMVAALYPRGAIAVEDIDFRGSFTHPRNAAYDRDVELYRETVRRRGGDADLGPRLPELLHQAGLERVSFQVVHPAHMDGDGKLVGYLTLHRIQDAVRTDGLATQDEVDQLLADLLAFTEDPRTVVSLPRIVQAWGTR